MKAPEGIAGAPPGRALPRLRTAPAIPAIALLFLIAGCSGSSEVTGTGKNAASGPADRTGEVRQPAAPELPKGKFTVQLGAFQSQDGAAAVSSLAKSRFSKEVYTLFDERDGFYKVMLGAFDTKDLARSFRDSIVRQFPQDYRDAWVSELAR
jgi:hypothetical protein